MTIQLLRHLSVVTLSLTVFASFQPKLFAQNENADDGDRQKRRVIVIEQDVDEPDGDKDRRIVIRQRELPKYWIGVACAITEDGVSIGEVLDDSPAEKAGLKAGDRIIAVGGQKVLELSDVVDSVQKAEGKEVKLEIQRGEETLNIAVTPEERPRKFDASGIDFNDLDVGEDWSRMIPHLRGLIDGELDDFDISMIHPGVVIGDEELPAGVSISIRREDDEPAKVTIKRDGETWEVTEDSIDELPNDLRGPARKMLAAAGGRSILRRPDIKRFEQIFPGDRDIRIERRRQSSDDATVELRKQLEEMRDEIRELRELLQELKSDSN